MTPQDSVGLPILERPVPSPASEQPCVPGTRLPWRIAITNRLAAKSAVAELILQRLRTYAPLFDSSQAGEVDLLVTTGAELDAATVEHHDLLILDATEANKESLMGEIGFQTRGDAWAYFVARIEPGHYRVIELPKDESVSVHEMPLRRPLPVAADGAHGATMTTVTRDRPEAAIEGLVDRLVEYRAAASQGVARRAGGPIPPDVKTWTISYTVEKRSCITHDNKTQTASLSLTYDVLAILNNPRNGAHYQYIYVHQKGVTNPGPLLNYERYIKGFGQFQLATLIAPEVSPSPLKYDASSPANVNDQRTIDSKIGFSVEYSEQNGATGEFNYEEGISQDVSDWQIVENTAGPSMSWVFAERYPLDYLKFRCGAGDGDEYPFGFWDDVKDFPNLTRYTLQPQTQAVWRTEKVLKEKVGLGASVTQYLRFFQWWGVYFDCPPAAVSCYQSLIIDLAKVS